MKSRLLFLSTLLLELLYEPQESIFKILSDLYECNHIDQIRCRVRYPMIRGVAWNTSHILQVSHLTQTIEDCFLFQSRKCVCVCVLSHSVLCFTVCFHGFTWDWLGNVIQILYIPIKMIWDTVSLREKQEYLIESICGWLWCTAYGLTV